jgi:hypothetical protein
MSDTLQAINDKLRKDLLDLKTNIQKLEELLDSSEDPLTILQSMKDEAK